VAATSALTLSKLDQNCKKDNT